MKIDDLAEYKYDEDLARENKCLVTIKGYNQQNIVKKILERKGNRSLGLTATSNPINRRYSLGSIFLIDLSCDSLSFETTKSSQLLSCLEPFCLELSGDYFAYTAGYEVVLWNVKLGSVNVLRNDWLSYIHTVHFSSDTRKILVASAGFDVIMEFSTHNMKKRWEWCSWDNGFSYSPRSNSMITRKYEEYVKLKNDSNCDVIYVKNPVDYPKEGIPTQVSPTRLNGAHYKGEQILVSFYHRPELFIINRDNSFQKIDLNLSHPHSFKAFRAHYHDGYYVANSGKGEFLFLNHEFEIVRKFLFKNLEANESKKKGFGEWIQTVSILNESSGIFTAVDALRDGIHIFNCVSKRRRFIRNPPEWTVQEARIITEESSFMITKVFSSDDSP